MASSNFVLIATLIVVVLLSKSVWGVYQKNLITQDKRDKSFQKLKNLEERKNELESQVAKLKTDRGVEEELREKFNIIKPGEEAIIIVDKDSGVGSKKVEVETGWLTKLKSLFKK